MSLKQKTVLRNGADVHIIINSHQLIIQTALWDRYSSPYRSHLQGQLKFGFQVQTASSFGERNEQKELCVCPRNRK